MQLDQRSRPTTRLNPTMVEDGQVSACPVTSNHLGCPLWHVGIG
jgi:hypothetical protein